jgi:hypothetical protein
MATCQCVIIIALQASICYLNTYQANLLPEPTSDSAMTASSTKDSWIPVRAADRLGRIKWENIAFMGFQVWFLGMALDAVSIISRFVLHKSFTQSNRRFIKIQQKFSL